MPNIESLPKWAQFTLKNLTECNNRHYAQRDESRLAHTEARRLLREAVREGVSPELEEKIDAHMAAHERYVTLRQS